MIQTRLYQQNKTVKWIITLYFLLTSVGFGIAALISHDRYEFDLERTKIYYLGSDQELAYPKLYSQLIQTDHVHSFTMPLVFLMVWLALSMVPIRHVYKMIMVVGAAAGIVLYNLAPFLLRFHSAKWVFLFPMGGILLFLFFYLPVLFILVETWRGFKVHQES